MRTNLLTAVMISGMLLSTASQAQTTLYGITNANAVFTMNDVNTPSVINGPYSVSGMASGQALVGLDTRTGNRGIYALGYDSVTQMAELYTLAFSGTAYTATAVSGTLASMNLGSTNNVAFDFIATADNQIRVIGRNGNNYVMNANNGTVMSTGSAGLSFALGDVYFGLSSVIAATAYTNSFYGSDATDEVGYDAANNVLVKMDAGSYLNGFNNTSNTLHSIGTTTGIVFATGGSIGMDTWYDSITHNNSIYIAGNTLLSGAHLYTYNLSSVTGTLTDLGAIGSGSLTVRDIAFGALGSSTASVAGNAVAGLTLNMRKLIYFDSQNPGNITNAVSLQGMTSGQSMIGIDYSSNGNLYGLGYNSTSHTYQLYTIDSATGMVTAVNASPLSLNLGTDDGSGNYINAGFRFIATGTNMIRIIGNNGATNVQLNAATGAVLETDTAIQYVTGDLNFGATAAVTSFAYTGYSGDASTQMFGFDANTGNMIMFDHDNTSAGFGIGSSGYINTGISLSSILSLFLHTAAYNNAVMNITYDAASASNVGLMATNYWGDSATAQGNYGVLYDMSSMLTAYHRSTSSSPAAIGTIGYGTPVKDIAMRRSTSPSIVNMITNTTPELLVYPNPATSVTHVVLPALSTGTVVADIIDMNGRVDYTYTYAPGTDQLDIDMSALPMGLYSVRVFDPAFGYYNLKVMKN